MNEYFDIAETYGGTVVNMSTYTDNYVNPLEMDVWSLDPNDSKGIDVYKRQVLFQTAYQMEKMHSTTKRQYETGKNSQNVRLFF